MKNNSYLEQKTKNKKMEIISTLGLDISRVENMSAGAFNNSSYFGYKSKILKSGICKYYRRKQFDKFEWCVLEMILFGIKSKGLLTNLLNRIRILIMEEVVFTQFDSILVCVKIIEKIDSHEKTIDEKIAGMLKVCQIVKTLKRGRIVSYVNCWWRLHPLNYNLECVPINKINQFKKKNDSDELLKYGEIFIHLMEKKDERMVDIFQKLYNTEGEFGIRYRRKEAIYLLFEIIESKFKKHIDFMVVFDFIKQMFFRKGMTERRSFGIWLVLIVWKFDKESKIDKDSSVESFGSFITKDALKIYMKSREKIVINETYVVEDYHISKSYGIESFGNEGCKVIDEELSILGCNGEKYKQHYIDDKNRKVQKIETKNMEVLNLEDKKLKQQTGIKKFGFVKKKKNTIKRNLVFNVKPSLPKVVDISRNDLLRFFEIKKIEKDELDIILELPHGQKLTNSSKKSVFVGRNYVFKGPFECGEKKMDNSIRFTLALKLLETISSIPISMKSCLMFEIKKYDGYYFFVSKNVGQSGIKSDQSVIIDTTILGKSFAKMKKKECGDSIELSKKIKVYPRGVIKRINDIIALYPEKLKDNIKIATLQHLYFRYLLDIGDSGPQNVLYREDGSTQFVSGIDMEEIRGRDQGNTRLEFLFNSRYNKKVALFRDCIDKIATVKYYDLEKYRNLFLDIGLNIDNIKTKIEKFDSSPHKP